jgi:hypothetical protein
MNSEKIKIIQQYFKDQNLYQAEVDGSVSSSTISAANHFMESQDSDLPYGWKRWQKNRRLTACLQLICKLQDIETGIIDGQWGQQTDYAFESYLYWLENNEMPPLFRDEDEVPVEGKNNDEVISETVANDNVVKKMLWPTSNESALKRYYGEPGSHLTYLIVPYVHRLAWDTSKTVTRIQCHEKVHDSLERVLSRVLDHYGEDEIATLHLDLFGGCFNKRKMRGGSRWSLHSWAIALDYDPAHNRLRWKHDRAAFAGSDYDQWWKLWEEEGWMSLGRTKNYDWMHVQATI